MVEKFFSQFFRWNYIFGLALMIASLPHSKFMMSVSQFWLAAVFIVDRIDIGKCRNSFFSVPDGKQLFSWYHISSTNYSSVPEKDSGTFFPTGQP